MTATMQAFANFTATSKSLGTPTCARHGPSFSTQRFSGRIGTRHLPEGIPFSSLPLRINRPLACRADSDERGRIVSRRRADSPKPADITGTVAESTPSPQAPPPARKSDRQIPPLQPTGQVLARRPSANAAPSPHAADPNPVRRALEWALRVPMNAEVAAIALVYFVQGVLGLSRLAVSFFLKDDLGLDPAEMAIVTGISTTPWLIKPLYGIISDSIPLWGYRRRSYLVACGLLGAASWSYMCLFADSAPAAIAAITASSLAVAFSDVVADSIVVERARHEPPSEQGVLQSLSWGAYAFGGIATAYFSGSLVASYGPRFVFGTTAVLPLIISGVGLLVDERPMGSKTLPSPAPAAAADFGDDAVAGNHRVADGAGADASVAVASSAPDGPVDSLRQQLLQLWGVIRQQNVWLPSLFVFVWQSTPHAESAMFYFTTNQLGFGPEFLGTVKLVTHVATLGGVILYNTHLKRVPINSMLLGTTLVGTTIGLSQLVLIYGINRQLGISDEFFTVGESLAISTLGQLAFMPVLVLAARICPPGVEATLFAALMSISNGAGMVGGLMGAGLTQYLGVTSDNFTNLGLLVAICNLSSLLPLPLLPLLSDDLVKPEEVPGPDGEDSSL